MQRFRSPQDLAAQLAGDRGQLVAQLWAHHQAEADRGKARRTAEDARTAARMAEEALMRALGERDMARRQLQEKDDQTAELQEQLLRAREELKFLKLQRFNEYRENEGSGNRKLPCF